MKQKQAPTPNRTLLSSSTLLIFIAFTAMTVFASCFGAHQSNVSACTTDYISGDDYVLESNANDGSFQSFVLRLKSTGSDESFAGFTNLASDGSMIYPQPSDFFSTGELIENLHYKTVFLKRKPEDSCSYGNHVLADVPNLKVKIVASAPDNFTSVAKLTVSIEGNVVEHSTQDLLMIAVKLTGLKFKKGIDGFTYDVDSSIVIPVKFIDAPQSSADINYSATTVNERTENDGQVSEQITIDLTNAKTFAKSSGTLDANEVSFSGASVPSGLTPVVTVVSSTQAKLSFTGSATTHATANSVTGVKMTLAEAAFSSSGVSNRELTFGIQFSDPAPVASLDYSADGVSESQTNNGAVADFIDMTLTNDTFSVASGDFSENTHYTLTGVPTGLTPVLTRTSATTARLSFMGTAASHAASDSVNGLTFTWLAAAFTSASAPSDGSQTHNFSITFKDPFILLYSGGSSDGNLGGRAGADALCVGQKPGTAYQPNVRALISVDANDEIRDMPANYNIPTGQVIKGPNDATMASNWADLVDGNLSTSVVQGSVTIATHWWSGSDNIGALSANNCNAWTSANGADMASVGFTGDTNDWMFATDSGCDGSIAAPLGLPVVLCVAFE